MPTLQFNARASRSDPGAYVKLVSWRAGRRHSIPCIVGVVAYARQRPRQVFELQMFVVNPNSSRKLGSVAAPWRRVRGS